MSEPPAFERVLASLYDAMLDDTHWPATAALIDEACGIAGNALMVGEGPQDDLRVLFVGLYYRRTGGIIHKVQRGGLLPIVILNYFKSIILTIHRARVIIHS